MKNYFHFARASKNPKLLIASILSSFGVILVLVGIIFTVIPPKPMPVVSSATSDGYATLLSDIRVNFTAPISRDTFQATMTPQVEGDWTWADPILGSKLFRSAVFQPSTPFEPETSYEVKLDGIKNFSELTNPKTHNFTFTTQPLPKVVSTDTDSKNQPIANDIQIEFDYPTNNAVEHSFSLTPFTEIEVDMTADGRNVTINPTSNLQQGTKYKLIVEQEVVNYDTHLGEITRRSEKSIIYTKSFRTVSPLGISNVTPQGIDVLPDQKSIEVTFDSTAQKKGAEKYLSLTPAVAGDWAWVNDKTIRFNFAKRLAFNTSYTLKVLPGLPGTDGRFFEEGGEFKFSTVGGLEVRYVSPRNYSYGISQSTPIIFGFNQPADQKSVVNSIEVSPSFKYSVQWLSNKSLKVTPTNILNHSTTYRVSLGTTAKSSYSLPMARVYSLIFTTYEKTTLLNIALDYQDRALSCELAALKMALSYKGVSVSESQLLAKVGYNPRPRSNNIWDDPNVMFVGDIDGSQNTTGYGVHWAPIAKAASYYREARSFSGWSLARLAQEIENGNPIVVWGTQGAAYYDPWKTSSGKTIAAWKGEHARTVVGFKGRSENPSAIILNDPINGRLVWSAAQFDSNWARMNRSGVVVY